MLYVVSINALQDALTLSDEIQDMVYDDNGHWRYCQCPPFEYGILLPLIVSYEWSDEYQFHTRLNGFG
jgi:hypothetical protein